MSPTDIDKTGSGSITNILRPASKNLGDFSVRRSLPAVEVPMVGPFIFFDHMGPADFPIGKGIEVRPHPHIGIATITYLFEGEIIHRDSLGYVQPIRPGEINRMTAGRGIVHSERAGEDKREQSRLHGLQLWIALPEELEEVDPAFDHYSARALPRIESAHHSTTVILGSFEGCTSPVKTYSPTSYLDFSLKAGAEVTVAADYEERAIYVADGEIAINGTELKAGSMAVLAPSTLPAMSASFDASVVLIGGAPVGKRYINWNFVSSSKSRIEAARQQWKEGRFPQVPGDEEYIPLPD